MKMNVLLTFYPFMFPSIPPLNQYQTERNYCDMVDWFVFSDRCRRIGVREETFAVFGRGQSCLFVGSFI